MIKLATKANSLVVAALLVALSVTGLLYARYDAEVRDAQEWVGHTYRVMVDIKELQLAVEGAETGQRGFVLTGRDTYLTPYEQGRDRASLLFGELKTLTADNPPQQEHLRTLSASIQQKLEELAQTIELRRSAGEAAALQVVNSGRGQQLMEMVRADLAAMTAVEQHLLDQRLAMAIELRRRTSLLAVGGSLVALVLFAIGGLMLRRAKRQRLAAEAELRAAMMRLRASFDSLSYGIVVFDDEGKLVIWNECFIELFAIPIDAIWVGMPYAGLAQWLGGGGDFLESEAQLHEDTPQPGRQAPVVYRRDREDGRTFELRRTPMPAGGGFAITFTDITAQLRAEAMQRETQKMRALGELTGGVAHDFNNLLTVIGGSLDLMRPRLHDPRLLGYLATALRGVERGATLTRHLLAFGRRQVLEPKPINVNKIMAEMTGNILRRTLGERIQIQFVQSASLWPAFADASQVENAVLNLALNARDAMPEGGKLTIETANVTLDALYAQMNAEVTPGQYIMIAVSDTGTGMPPEIVARAFEPFFTTKEEGRGSGLGLAMVHGFAKQSKGHVKIYSEPGHGTAVKLYLPRSPRAAVEELLTPAALPRGSATVLVVEDDTDVRRIAVAQLRELGYTVLDAADAESALKLFADAARIDLLLTDVVLPGRLRGRDFARFVRRASPGTRVLFMSGYTENAIVHDGKLDEGVVLLMKPFRREELATKVAFALSADAGLSDGGTDPLPAGPLR